MLTSFRFTVNKRYSILASEKTPYHANIRSMEFRMFFVKGNPGESGSCSRWFSGKIPRSTTVVFPSRWAHNSIYWKGLFHPQCFNPLILGWSDVKWLDLPVILEIPSMEVYQLATRTLKILASFSRKDGLPTIIFSGASCSTLDVFYCHSCRGLWLCSSIYCTSTFSCSKKPIKLLPLYGET